jgi:hypothetical protein
MGTRDRDAAILLAVPEVDPAQFEPACGGATDLRAALAAAGALALIEAADEASLERETEKARARLQPGDVLAWKGYAESTWANRYLNALRHQLPLVRLAGTDLVVSRMFGVRPA